MAIRTNDAEVREILGTNYDSKSKLGQFFLAANVMVNRAATCATAKGVTVTSAEWKVIETWVAAHLYCCMDAMYTSRSTSGASGSFQRKAGGEGLAGTEYGQMAMLLDPSNCLTEQNSTQRFTVEWLGLPPSDQTDFIDRD
jgi:hypothetical protein